MQTLNARLEFNISKYLGSAPKYNPDTIMDQETASRLKQGMTVRVADNLYTRCQFITLGGLRGTCVMPGNTYVVEAVTGLIIKLSEGRGYWGLNWFEKNPVGR